MDTRPFMKLLEDGKTVLTRNSYDSTAPLPFYFDRVLDPEALQSTVYEVAGKPIVDSVLKGFNGTVLAYGQTSSGKTYTMTGPDAADSYYKGIIPRTIRTIFAQIQDSSEEIEYTIKLSYCEIYLERIRDLLQPSKSNLRILEDKVKGVFIEELTEQYVSQDVEVTELLALGNSNRQVGHTRMNIESSRSHAICLITVSQNNLLDLSAKTGKLYLVDLAGSEKVSKTKAKGKRLDEAKKINQSLSSLGLVIKSLTDGKSAHIPYRDSKLTRVLQESLGGNSLTCLIITCSLSRYNEQETLSTLRFGVRAKAIKNNPKINKELTIPELKLLLTQNKGELTEKHQRIILLEQFISGLGGAIPAGRFEDETDQTQDLVAELHSERLRLAEELELTASLKEDLAAEAAAHEASRTERELLSEKVLALTLAASVREDSLQDLKDNSEKSEREIEILNMQITLLASCNAQLEQQLSSKDKELEIFSFSSSEFRDFTSVREQLDELKEKYVVQSQILRQARSKSLVQGEIDEFLSETVVELGKQPLLDELSAQQQANEELQSELDAAKQRLEQLEATRSAEKLALKTKTNALEGKMNYLTMLYQQQVGNTDLTQNKATMYEKELNRKKEMIEKLVGQLTQARDLINSYRDKLGSLQEIGATNKSRGIRKIVKGGMNPRLQGMLSSQVYDVK